MKQNIPNFFIPGAGKAGTTSLHYYLSQHPSIFLPKEKETAFFSTDKLYSHGINWYLSKHFSHANNYLAIGEASPPYLYYADKVAQRIEKHYKTNTPRFIIIFRDPVKRAYSQYWKSVLQGFETLSFEKALTVENDRINNPLLSEEASKWGSYAYYNAGLYGKYVSKYLEYFDRSNFLFLFFEDLVKDAKTVCKDIFRFLEVDESININTNMKYNVSGVPRFRLINKLLRNETLSKIIKKDYNNVSYFSDKISKLREFLIIINTVPKPAPPINKATEVMLRQKYYNDILLLQKITGKNLGEWLP